MSKNAIDMFGTKAAFKEEFARRLEERYGRSVQDSHITERYVVLGEMVRDYAGKDWRSCREDILGKVWQEDGYVLERTVDVHITRLRKKLGEYGKQHIANRSGYGYCLEF